MLRTRIVAGATALTIAIGAFGAMTAPASADGRPGYHGGGQQHGEHKPPGNKKPQAGKPADRGGSKGGHGGGQGPDYAGGWGHGPGWGPGPGWGQPGYHPRPPRPPKPWQVRPGARKQVCTPRFETVRRWTPYRGWVVRQVYVGQSCQWQPAPRHRGPRW